MSNSSKSLISVQRSAFSLYAVCCILYAAVTIFLFSVPAQAKYGGGTGTADDPYQIATAADLIALGETPEDYDKHFILVDDIDLAGRVFDKAIIAPDTNDIESGFQGTSFTGVFDGNAHTISHLTISGKDYLGLFGQLRGQVENVGIVDVNISGLGICVGGLVGHIGTGTISSCYSTGAIFGETSVGGLVGKMGMDVCRGRGSPCVSVGGNIDNCYSTCSVTGTTTLGGLVGFNYAGTITTCYSVGRVSGNEQVGGLVGSGYYGTTSECFWDIQSSGQNWSHGGTGKTTGEMQTESTFLCWASDPAVWTIDEGKDYPRLWWEDAPGHAITRHYYYGGGSGTQADPYLIYTAEQLNMIGTIDCDRDKHFKLMADIDLSVLAGVEFNTIGSFDVPFTGVFDGGGHAIAHLTLSGDADLVLFGCLESGAEVKDLGIVDVNITSLYSAAGLVMTNNGTVTRCYSSGAVSGYAGVGGLVGYNYGTVTRCYSTVVVSGTGEHSAVGGLIGSNSGTVTHCYSTGAVDGNDAVGGLVGQQNYAGSVMHCYSTSPVHGVSSIGGLIGSGVSSYFGTLLHSVWDMQTSGLSGDARGVGLTTEEMMDPYMLGLNGFANDPNWVLDPGHDYPRLAWQGTPGDIIPEPVVDWLEGEGTSDSPYRIDTADQLILLSKASILWDKHFVVGADIDLDPILPNGQVFTRAVIQTFTGVFDGQGHAISHLTILGAHYLGLFGQLGNSNLPVGDVKNLGVVDVNIAGSGYSVGSLVGNNYGTVARCYSTGAVKGTYFSTGGLVARNYEGTVTECYSASSVSGAFFVGGLIGDTYKGAVTECYSTGSVSGEFGVGGLVGDNGFGEVTNCYSTSAVSGSTVGGLIGWNLGGVSRCYSTGPVSGSSSGGLVGWCAHVVTASVWDMQTSGQTKSCGGGLGKTTAEMQTAKTFLEAGWDFIGETVNGTEDIWWILEGKDYPRLWWEAAEP